MNKLAVIVPFYKRHRLTSLCFKRLKAQSKRLKFDVIVAGSEGEESKEIAKGLKYIEVPNKPLGKKLNTLMQECRDYDGVIIIGSDNFMSDSIVKMYQQIDCSKPVYYAFNDILIYSAKYKKVMSDFDYTRVGNSIGVARLYTKPTLEKMDYKVWEDDRQKGLDGSAERMLKTKGIKEVVLPLDNHFLIDVKIEQNISAHEIINTGHKEHEITVFNKIRGVGKEILELKAEAPERIRHEEKSSKIKCKVIKAFNQFNKGDIVEFKEKNYRELLRAKYIIPFAE